MQTKTLKSWGSGINMKKSKKFIQGLKTSNSSKAVCTSRSESIYR